MKRNAKSKSWVGLLGLAALCACRPVSPPVATLATPGEIRQQLKELKAPATLVHLWATWCAPCREEFPELLKVYRNAHKRGLALLLVSADHPDDLEAVNRFLAQHQSPVGSMVSTALDQEFIELFSAKWSGALPASFFFDADGNLVAEWEGKRSYEEYMDTLEPLLNP